MRHTLALSFLSTLSSCSGFLTPNDTLTSSRQASKKDWQLTQWRDVKCDYGTLTNAQNDPVQMFVDSKAAEAYREMWRAYIGNKSTVPFSNWIANYFHARPDINCGLLENANCEVTINCGEGDAPNAPTNSPAGYMIVNSMVSLHQHLEAQYKGMMNALNFMNGEVGTFSAVFATNQDLLKQNKVLVDVVSMLYGTISALLFNSWLLRLPYFKANSHTRGVTKDATNAYVTQALNIVKDSMSAVDELGKQNSVSSFLSQTVRTWVGATRNMTHHIFEEDPKTLYEFIVDGKAWDSGANHDALNVTDIMRKALYAYIIPFTWKLQHNPEVGAFVATSEGVRMFGDKKGCKDYDPYKTHSRDYYLDKNALAKYHFCDEEGKAYWLVNLKRSPKKKNDCSVPGSGGGTSYCTSPEIHSLPGADTLDGSKWGGVKAEELALAAVKAWKANGKRNGWKSADPTSDAGFTDVFDNGFHATGMINIPVCSFTEALANGYPGIKNDNWPCNQ